jgi:hypothetical protein
MLTESGMGQYDLTLPDLLVADNKFPLKQGDELFADLPDAEPDQNMKFTVDIAFGIPDVFWGQPFVKTLDDMERRSASSSLDSPGSFIEPHQSSLSF